MRTACRGILFALLAGAQAHATQWVTMGPRAMGMGGAFTAVAQGPVGAYYNPGALGQIIDNPSGVQVMGGAHVEIAGPSLQGANDYYQVAQACKTGAADCTQAKATAANNLLTSPGSGLLADASGGVAFKFGRLALFAQNFSYRGTSVSVPYLFRSPTAPGGLHPIQNSTTDLRLRGSSIYELGAGYGREILESGVFVGMNLKALVARNGFSDIYLAQERPQPMTLLKNYDRSTKTSFMPGVDVGLLWDVKQTFADAPFHPRFGVVGHNVNNPRFDMPDRASAVGDSHRFYDQQGQSRFGAALDLTSWCTVAADLDLTENLTQVEGYTERMYAAGMEVRLINDPAFAIPVRAGVSKNIVRADSKTLLSAGLGLHLINFNIDLAASVPAGGWQAVQTVNESQKLPQQLAISAQFALLFGGAESITEPNRDPFATPVERPRERERRSPTYFQ
ncbi:MAG: conjugal transfer protein TraF [Elusimicrobia bacterium]|nr:conjugal transfer protein TraF [Elusimicrobiota bacterium]